MKFKTIIRWPARVFHRCTAPIPSVLINTPLQRGVGDGGGVETVSTVLTGSGKPLKQFSHLPASFTPLKRCVNERGYEVFGQGLYLAALLLLTALPLAAIAQTVAPSAETLERLAKEAYVKFKDDQGGKNADYIPALAQVPSNLFGITIVTVDGKVINVGDVDTPFSMQSCSKVFTMCLVMQESGDKAIYDKINVEPTGEAFNSIRAIEEGDGRADNPFVNPGAIATVSLVKAKSAQERWDKIIGCYNQFAGEKLTVLEDIYKSEAETNFRNRGIAHILFNSGHLYAEPLECTDVYTKQCSIGVTCKQLAVMGSVLANHGVNPVTKERCLDAKYVPKVLSVMTIAGFYDGSGAWAWNAGLPAKTGVGGGIVAVVPGRMAIVGFAPPLDKFGNSVRAQKAIQYIAEQLDLSIFGSAK